MLFQSILSYWYNILEVNAWDKIVNIMPLSAKMSHLSSDYLQVKPAGNLHFGEMLENMAQYIKAFGHHCTNKRLYFVNPYTSYTLLLKSCWVIHSLQALLDILLLKSALDWHRIEISFN